MRNDSWPPECLSGKSYQGISLHHVQASSAAPQVEEEAPKVEEPAAIEPPKLEKKAALSEQELDEMRSNRNKSALARADKEASFLAALETSQKEVGPRMTAQVPTIIISNLYSKIKSLRGNETIKAFYNLDVSSSFQSAEIETQRCSFSGLDAIHQKPRSSIKIMTKTHNEHC